MHQIDVSVIYFLFCYFTLEKKEHGTRCGLSCPYHASYDLSRRQWGPTSIFFQGAQHSLNTVLFTNKWTPNKIQVLTTISVCWTKLNNKLLVNYLNVYQSRVSLLSLQCKKWQETRSWLSVAGSCYEKSNLNKPIIILNLNFKISHLPKYSNILF